MGQKGGQKGSRIFYQDQKGGQNGSKILPKRRSYQKCTKNGSKRVKDLRGELLILRENRYVKVLYLLTVPLVVMLLVLNTSTVFGP